MRGVLCTGMTAIAAAAFAVGAALTPVSAQTGQPEFKQVKLSEKYVQGFIAAQKDLAAMAAQLQAAGDKPDAKLQAELEAVATKNGFANFADLDDVAANISMVMAGLDPQSGEYMDPIEAIKKEMDEIKKDDKIPEKDKKQMLEEMDQALKSTPPLQHTENVAIVKKFQKDIEKALQ
jgi:SPX domain protein involved in polyphosphate accumulation